MPISSDNVVSFWISASGSPDGDGSQQNPFDTIEKAQAAVRTVLQAPGALEKDIVVNIGDGTYQLQNTLSFDAQDSGRDGHMVHYRAVDGEHPVISGGMAVTGWTTVNDPGLALAPGAQLWQASIDPAIDSRQLYIDGVRALRAETNGDAAYPVGFRPSYYEEPGIAGIKYATNIDNNPNSPNWQDPTQWKNVQDIEAVIYSQWKMASVPLSKVSAPDPSTSTGLIELLDPAWTNANLIRNAPQGIVDPSLGVIQLVANEPAGYLAQVETYIGNITTGMIVTGGGIPNDQPVTVQSVDPVAKTVTLSSPLSMLASDQPVGLTFTDPTTHAVVTTNANEWAFWRVSKFVNAYDFLDQPNEWYLDRSTGTLFLVTQAGDDPNTKDIQLPLLEKLVEGNGASNMSFEGLSFQYGTWLDPSRVTATVDPVSGRPVGEGEPGELVFTTLTKEAMPVVRYRTRDLTRLMPGSVTSMRRMAKITGRSDDMLIVRGVNLFPSQVEEQILRDPALSGHYVIELSRTGALDDLLVRVEGRQDQEQAARLQSATELARRLKGMCGLSADVEIAAPGTIERSLGKARRVIDRRPKV